MKGCDTPRFRVEWGFVFGSISFGILNYYYQKLRVVHWLSIPVSVLFANLLQVL